MGRTCPKCGALLKSTATRTFTTEGGRRMVIRSWTHWRPQWPSTYPHPRTDCSVARSEADDCAKGPYAV